MGDKPADALANALASLQPKPSLQQLADALASALRDESATVTQPQPFASLVIEAPGGVRARSTGSAPNEFTSRIRDAITSVAATYEHRWNRAPSLRELLATVQFVLGAEASRYVADASRVDAISAVEA